MSKETGGNAFPAQPKLRSSLGYEVVPQGGMTLRDYFAAKAMQAIIMGNQAHFASMTAGAVGDAYAVADLMLAERAKP